jgi:hypothetical protein
MLNAHKIEPMKSPHFPWQRFLNNYFFLVNESSLLTKEQVQKPELVGKIPKAKKWWSQSQCHIFIISPNLKLKSTQKESIEGWFNNKLI